MEIEECIRFANENRVAWVATVDGDQPRVRPLDMWFADATGFYFQTWTLKDLHRELTMSPRVELGFWKPGEDGGTVLRVAGPIEWLDDPALKRRSFEERPFLADLGLTPESPELALFRLAWGEAYVWTVATNLAPKQMIRFGE
ncbi:MAG: pyridoxamine 5'-phosphate oxidase family protein [Methanospirillum sp.]